jgi:DNA mismatch repair protein MutS2
VETRERLETEAADAEKLRRRLDEERRALEEERRSVGPRYRAELEAFRRETAERLRAEMERLREHFEQGRRKGLVAESVEALFAEAPELGEPEPAAAGPLVAGGPVRHLGFGWQGVLEKLEGGRAEVLVRGKRLRCRAEELAPAGPDGSAGGARERPSRRPAEAASPRPGRDLDESVAVPPELHLIGMRVEPALEILDGYLDRALLASRKEVRVVHGHGSGRLRDAVRQHLRSHRGVAGIRPGAPNEGGNGATVVVLGA